MKRLALTLITSLALLVGAATSPLMALAQSAPAGGNVTGGGGIYNPVVQNALGSDRAGAKSGASLNTFMEGILRFLIMFAAFLVLIELINAAYNWIGSAGDKGKLEKARNQITHAIIGLILLAASVAVLDLVLDFIDVSLDFTQLFQ